MKYRPEIDGLRAIAVLAVIFYHAQITFFGFSVFKGGFLGVDVFFVISGYLISSIILKSFSDKTFSIVDFYDRRARRILPTLYFVMLISVPFAWRYLFPDALRNYFKSITSTILFSSNILFWREDSYTAEISSLKPFLHTWSLSLEEQFYLIFPVILFLIYKYFRNHAYISLLVGFLMSIIIADWSSVSHINANFYLLPTRAWQLLAGVLIAVYQNAEGSAAFAAAKSKKFIYETASALGFFLILYSLVFFNDQMNLPSFKSLVPVLGTVLLIVFSGGDDLITKILSSYPFRSIGLISYSLYLWHQPVFVLFRIRSLDPLTNIDKIEIIFICLLLSLISYNIIEKQFRKKKIGKKVYIPALVVSASFLLSMDYYSKDGRPDRFPPVAQEIVKSTQKLIAYPRQNQTECFNRKVSDACSFGDNKKNISWIMIGDSHLGTIASVLKDKIDLDQYGLTLLNMNACMYVPGMEVYLNNSIYPSCGIANRERAAYLANSTGNILVIGGRLPVYLTGKHFNNEEGADEGDNTYVYSRVGGFSSEAERMAAVKKSIVDSTVDFLKKGNKIILVYPVPEVGWNIPRELFKIVMSESGDEVKKKIDTSLTTSYEVFLKRNKGAYDVYDSIPNHYNLIRIYPETLFCNTEIKGRCITHSGKKIYYADTNHLTLSGSEMLVQKIISEAHSKWGF